MVWVKRFVVRSAERWCTHLHWLFHSRPWLWLPLPVCPLSTASYLLDERWQTGEWEQPG